MVSLAFSSTKVLVSCADSGEIRRYALDAVSGRLAEQQTVAAGGQLMPMALSADRSRLYVARRSAPLAALTLGIGADGSLRVLGEAALPASMAYVACDRSGRWLLSASYGEHRVAVSPVGGDGVAAPAHQVLPVGRHAHSIVVDPSNRHAYVACLGDDVLVRLDFDAAAGVLAGDSASVFPMRAGAGPRHLVITADGRCLFLLNELDATIDVLERDVGTGALQRRQTVALMPAGFEGKPWAAELRLSPDGAWLLATERRAGTMSLLAVQAGRGDLTLADRVAVEAQPRGMHWSPDGRHALVAGQTSHHLASWHVDRTHGRLVLCDRVATGLNPNWIETL
jgi:6-phosphogluconolactonase